jgi:hypothetical protein
VLEYSVLRYFPGLVIGDVFYRILSHHGTVLITIILSDTKSIYIYTYVFPFIYCYLTCARFKII